MNLVIDLVATIGAARLVADLAPRAWNLAARLCAGSPLDHATRRLATWILR